MLNFFSIPANQLNAYKDVMAFKQQTANFFDLCNRQKGIPCQLTPFSAFFCRPSPILLKFGMFVVLDEKMSHTKFQVSKSTSF